MIHIMMATYNGEAYLREQLDSILYQTYKEWKIWIHDDGSTDGTLQILKEYQEKYPDYVQIIHSEQKTMGAKANFSYIYRYVPLADYYVFCDQDDIWSKDKLSVLLNEFPKNEKVRPCLIYHDAAVVDQNKNIIASSFFKYTGLDMDKKRKLQQILLYNYVPGCTMMFNHALKKAVSIIPKECVMHDWWMLLSAHCLDAKVIKSNEILIYYRQHGNNEMGAAKKINFIKLAVKCLNIIKMNRYLENNRKMKKERISHAKALLGQYSGDMSSKNEVIIKEYLNILTERKKWVRFSCARRKGFIFYNTIYSLKFYLFN